MKGSRRFGFRPAEQQPTHDDRTLVDGESASARTIDGSINSGCESVAGRAATCVADPSRSPQPRTGDVQRHAIHPAGRIAIALTDDQRA